MSAINIEYRGHTITWSDNEDCWTCWDLGMDGRSSPKLSVLKAGLDKLYLTQRKAASVQCWELHSHNAGRHFGSIIEYEGPKTERSYRHGVPDKVSHRVGVVAKRGDRERASRRTVNITELAPVGEATDKAWAEYEAAVHERKLAEQREKAAFAAVPRMSLDDIKELVALASKGDDNA